MSKEVSCYKCGFDYARKVASECPKCGEARIFTPEKDDPNYDWVEDTARDSKFRVITALVITAIAVLAIIVLGK